MKMQKDVILDSIPDVILYLSRNLEVIWANPAAFKAFRTNPEELIGKKESELWTESEEERRTGLSERALETGKLQVGEVRDRLGKTWRLKAVPIAESKDRPPAVLVIASDPEARRGKAQTSASDDKSRKIVDEIERSNVLGVERGGSHG